MIVKCMSDENGADDDSRKTYRIIAEVESVEFVRTERGPVAAIGRKDGTFHEEYLRGNAYVMNDAGKTVSSFGFAELPPDSRPQLPAAAP